MPRFYCPQRASRKPQRIAAPPHIPYQQALAWFRKAAVQGHANAQTNLGLMYAKGQGVPKDFVLAYMLSNLGTTGGSEHGRNVREIIIKSMTPRQIEEAQTLTRNWKVGTPLPTKSKTGQR